MPSWTKMLPAVLLPGIASALLAGCDEPTVMDGPVERSWGRMKGLEKIVGNMEDRSWSTGRTQAPRPSASGRKVHLTDFEGKFVWAEYAATWCPACRTQTPETRQVERELGDEIIFLTVMTAKSQDYNDHATEATARSWADQFGLDPERVVAAELWAKMIPEHRLYSPEGHTLFVHVGSLSADQIKAVIAHYRTGWQAWKKSGKPADWMTSS